MLSIPLIIALVYCTIGSITDLRTLEVPDRLNYSLIVLGFAYNIMAALFNQSWQPIITSIFGFLFALLVGMSLYHLGQWGGGDAKLLFGLGALFGLQLPIASSSLVLFLLNLAVAGGIYGIGWITYKAYQKRKDLHVTKSKYHYVSLLAIIVIMIASVIIAIDFQLKMILMLISLSILMLTHLMPWVKAIEKNGMTYIIPISKLTEGDWITQEIWIDRKKTTLLDHLRQEQRDKNQRMLKQNILLRFVSELETLLSFKQSKVFQGIKQKITKWLTKETDIAWDIAKAYATYDKQSVLSMIKKIFFQKSKYVELHDKITNTKYPTTKPLLSNSPPFDQFCKEYYHYQPSKYLLAGPTGLGLEKYQLDLLKKHKIQHVEVKYGMPFVPSFLIAMIFTTTGRFILLSLV